MDANNPTFELGFLYDFEDLENVSKTVTKTSQAFKHQQSESATSFVNLSERDLKKYLKINNKTRPRKALTGVFLRSRVSSNFR